MQCESGVAWQQQQQSETQKNIGREGRGEALLLLQKVFLSDLVGGTLAVSCAPQLSHRRNRKDDHDYRVERADRDQQKTKNAARQAESREK